MIKIKKFQWVFFFSPLSPLTAMTFITNYLLSHSPLQLCWMNYPRRPLLPQLSCAPVTDMTSAHPTPGIQLAHRLNHLDSGNYRTKVIKTGQMVNDKSEDISLWRREIKKEPEYVKTYKTPASSSEILYTRLRTVLFHLQFCWFWVKGCQSYEFALCLVLFLYFDSRF